MDDGRLPFKLIAHLFLNHDANALIAFRTFDEGACRGILGNRGRPAECVRQGVGQGRGGQAEGEAEEEDAQWGLV